MDVQNPQTRYHERDDLLPLLTGNKSVFFDPFANTSDTAPLLREMLLALVKSMPERSQVQFRAAELTRPGQHYPHPAVEVRCGGRFQAMLLEQFSPSDPERKSILRVLHTRYRRNPSLITSREQQSRTLISYCEWRAKRDGVLLPNHCVTLYGDHSVRIEESSLALDFSTLPASGLTIDGATIKPVVFSESTREIYCYSSGRRRFNETVTVPGQRFVTYTLPQRITDYDPDNVLISASFDGEPDVTGAAVIGYERRARSTGSS